MTSTTSGRAEAAATMRLRQRERSTRRFHQVVLGEFGTLVWLNVLLLACVLPAAALYALALVGVAGGWLVLVAVVASAPVGGALGAGMFCLTRLLQHQPVAVWFDFRRTFAANWRLLAIPGMALSAFVFAQLYFWVTVFSGAEVALGLVVLLTLSFAIVLAIAPYVFLQVVHLEAGLGRVLANALLLASSHVVRTCAGLLAGAVGWVLVAFLLPVSLFLAPVAVIVGLSLSLLANLVLTWPVVDGQFGITDEMDARRARQVQDIVTLLEPPQ